MGEVMPKAILFDLDDTILDSDSGVDPCWRDVCKRFAGELEGISPEQLRSAVYGCRQRFWSDPEQTRRGRLRMLDARRAIVAEALACLGVEAPEPAVRIADAYAAARSGWGCWGSGATLRAQACRPAPRSARTAPSGQS